MSSPYTPLENEVIISGLPISSGGIIWAGETVVIALNTTAADFYVKDAATGALIKVDLGTAEQLYAAAKAINLLNTDYTHLNVQDIPSANWAPVINSAANVAAQEAGAGFLASFLPQLPKLLVPVVAPEALLSAAETLVSTVAAIGVNVTELALTDAVLINAQTLLNSSYSDYQKYIYDYMVHSINSMSVGFAQPIDYSLITHF
jgi:hypothetical protein